MTRSSPFRIARVVYVAYMLGAVAFVAVDRTWAGLLLPVVFLLPGSWVWDRADYRWMDRL